MRTAMAIGLAAISVAWPRCAAAEREPAAITLRVHDYAGVPSRSLERAQRLVSKFYDQVGVRTRWAATVARRIGRSAPGPVEDVSVIVLTRRMSKGNPAVEHGMLGFAATSHQPPGRVAYVVYDHVDMAAVDSDWTLSDLLSVVIAHEVAHLYLPPGSHSPDGLMRGFWTVDVLRRTDPENLRFTARQGELLRTGVGEPPAATIGSAAQIVGEPLADAAGDVAPASPVTP
jgi:hypothetical protein